MAAPSPPSFDHLPFAIETGRERYAAHPIQAQICRNGQMKYHRMHAHAPEKEIVMPDGEVVQMVDGDPGTRGFRG